MLPNVNNDTAAAATIADSVAVHGDDHDDDHDDGITPPPAAPQRVFFLVTTCLLGDPASAQYAVRKEQYVRGISRLLGLLDRWSRERDRARVVVVENNGPRVTFLDALCRAAPFPCDLAYTRTNALYPPQFNKGIKELDDVRDDDFVVKMTGRYLLHDDGGEFLRVLLQEGGDRKYDVIARFGPYFAPVNYQMDDCVTGLVGMRCKYVKQIAAPEPRVSVEVSWAKASFLAPSERVRVLPSLGILICPGCNTYFDA